MKLSSARSITLIAGLCIGSVALVIAASISGKHANAAEPPPINLKQPACTCTPSELSTGHTLYNCQCGVLQCVVMDSKNQNATSGMYCTK